MTPLGWLLLLAWCGAVWWLARVRVDHWRTRVDVLEDRLARLLADYTTLEARDAEWRRAVAQVRGRHKGES